MIGLAEDWESECGGQQSGAGSESAFVRRGHYGEEAPIRTRMDGHGEEEEEEERAAAMCNGVVIELRPPSPQPQHPQRTQRRQIPRHSGLSLGLASPTPSSSHTLLLHLILWLRPKSSNLYHNINSACFKIHVLSRSANRGQTKQYLSS